MSVSSTEIFIVLLVALIVLGPTQLPDAMKRLGKAYREFRTISTTVQREINSVVNETTGMLTGTAETLSGQASDGVATSSSSSSPGTGEPQRTNQSYRPADELPADELPDDEVSADDVPVDEASAAEAPADEAPVDETGS
ncbi:MAG: twin-arginine translocase TatA/TatE family subunit [Actinomycetia bacterium]|nr:twin-arginine translocase TatA/TatE family subunit [Actinomycetes bacterium]MCP4959316.1 twin-arginine translocase TatA/TatE family subunit [Actinomycetes bacterium]